MRSIAAIIICEEGSYAYSYAVKTGHYYDLTTGHKPDSGKITKKPTYEATGIKTYTCETCGRVVKTKVLAKRTPKATTLIRVTASRRGFTAKWSKAKAVKTKN